MLRVQRPKGERDHHGQSMEAGRYWLPLQGLMPRPTGVGVEVVDLYVGEEVVNLPSWVDRVAEQYGSGLFLGWVEYLEVVEEASEGFFGVKHLSGPGFVRPCG